MPENPPSITAKKSLGQHFLNNPNIPRKMADAASVGAGDTVLEIGPGTGVLTRDLLSRGATVVAIEADRRAIDALQETFPGEIKAKKLVIFHDDARSLVLDDYDLPKAYKVVANIPYYLSGLLFRAFLAAAHQPSCLVFLVQREVAERITRDSKESILSLSVKVFGEPRYVETVRKGNFTPAPKVDSAIIAVTDISRERLGDLSEALFFEVVRAGFASRRKQLLGNLTALLPREALIHIFSTLGIPENVRGEDLSLDGWLALASAVSAHPK